MSIDSNAQKPLNPKRDRSRNRTSSGVPLVLEKDYTTIDLCLDQLSCQINWPHSFIREFYVISGRTLCDLTSDDGTKSVGDAPGDDHIRLVVATVGDGKDSGKHGTVEFLFYNVKSFHAGWMSELGFNYRDDGHSRYSVNFTHPSNADGCWIYSEAIYVRFLQDFDNGIDFLLGHPFPGREWADAFTIQDDWRQCKDCQNIWQVPLDRKWDHCPDCGKLTKLTNSHR